jgi:hypothetical protein
MGREERRKRERVVLGARRAKEPKAMRAVETKVMNGVDIVIE